MYQELINHNSDLKKLQDEGFEIEIRDKHILISNIPYLNQNKELKYGTLISVLNFSGIKVLKPNDHTAYFSGERPCNKNGSPIEGFINSTSNKILAGIKCNFYLSNKPSDGYNNYYDKMTRYIDIISAPATSLYESATAKTFKKIVSTEQSNFVYEDTNSSRTGIDNITNKIKDQKIGIVGLGGTGSYILDHLAKTPVAEIHLYDKDDFCQHNAFRAPGAPTIKCLSKKEKKVSYYKKIYSRMHKGIKSHIVYISKQNIKKLLKNLDFVFINIDNGTSKKFLVEYLVKNKIPFIDTGIDVSEVDNQLNGNIRVTSYTTNSDILARISYDDDSNDLYASNIQISELNALAALHAIIKWKKINNIYLDCNIKDNMIYDTNDGEIKYED